MGGMSLNRLRSTALYQTHLNAFSAPLSMRGVRRDNCHSHLVYLVGFVILVCLVNLVYSGDLRPNRRHHERN